MGRLRRGGLPFPFSSKRSEGRVLRIVIVSPIKERLKKIGCGSAILLPARTWRHLLNAETGHGVAPVGIAQSAQRTNLKRIVRTGRQTSHDCRRFRFQQRYRGPRTQRSARVQRRISQFKGPSLFGLRLHCDLHLAAVRAAIDPEDRSGRHRLLCAAAGYSRSESARRVRGHVIVAVVLDIYRQFLQDAYQVAETIFGKFALGSSGVAMPPIFVTCSASSSLLMQVRH